MKQQKRYDQYMYSYPHKRAYYPLEGAAVWAALAQWDGEELTLYVHIPFCSGKCGYCNLFSLASAKEDVRKRYMDTVCRQIRQYGAGLSKKQFKIKQVILGGGTPFILSIEQFLQLFEALEQAFHFSLLNCGFDIETSPGETTEEKLLFLKQRGMRRLSIGIQSFKEEELKRIYRHHGVKSCHEALAVIKKVGTESLNVDLIYGIEGQTEESFQESLRMALLYDPDELFLYPLYIRRDTMLYGRMRIDESRIYELYQFAVGFLRTEGYKQTSMRRFVKIRPDAGILNGEVSCGFESMLSLGCGGRSYIGDLHFCEPYEVNAEICYEILENYMQKDHFMDGLKGYALNQDEQMRRFIIKNLGYYNGLSLAEYAECFGQDLLFQFGELWQELNADGQILIGGGRITLTPKGMGNSDCILAMWISEAVNRGMNRC